MSAGPLAVKQKTDNSIKLNLSVLATDGSTSDQNITGWTLTFLLKKNAGDADSAALIAKSITTHSDPTHGVSYVPLTATDLALVPRTYYANVRSVDGSGATRDTGQ